MNASTRLTDIPELKACVDYLMYRYTDDGRPAAEMSISQMLASQPTWDADSMLRGLERLCQVASTRRMLYVVYPQGQGDKRDAKLFFLPAEHQPSDKPFVICVSGGGYSCVCSAVESFPVGARLNALGYNVFALNYRVGEGVTLPAPVEDLAAAVKLILANPSEFGLVNTDYVVNGYSAGGSLVTIYGTERNGWAKYGCPRPIALFPIYPAISTAPEFIPDPQARLHFMGRMFGPGFDEAYARSFDVPDCMTDSYPPCYLVHAKDDPAVPVAHSLTLERLLQERGVPVRAEIIEKGGHGWGDGSDTAAEGWVDRAAAFLEGLQHMCSQAGIYRL